MISTNCLVIELHAQFLELNFLSQIRAIPNPELIIGSDKSGDFSHPLTLHLSPTSSVSVIVTSITPTPLPSTRVTIISRDAEVIVAPKRRQSWSSNMGEVKKVLNSGRLSVSGKSVASTSRRRHNRNFHRQKDYFTRAVDRSAVMDQFDDNPDNRDIGLKVWLSRKALTARQFRGVGHVLVSVLDLNRKGSLSSLQEGMDGERCATSVVAKLGVWEDAPNARYSCFSSILVRVLGYSSVTGEIAKIEAAPNPGHSNVDTGKVRSNHVITVHPFARRASNTKDCISFGNKSRTLTLRETLNEFDKLNAVLQGPVTEGMLIPSSEEPEMPWPGGIVKIENLTKHDKISSPPPVWVARNEDKPSIDVQSDVSPPIHNSVQCTLGESLPLKLPVVVGNIKLISRLDSQLLNCSSILLTGALSIGKSTIAKFLAMKYRNRTMSKCIWISCRTVTAGESRIAAIKVILNNAFASAARSCRFGGCALIVLDDLDRLCPAETELQVGDNNYRSLQLAESFCLLMKKFCSVNTNIAILATAQSRDSIHDVIVGGHVMHEVVSIQAPTKEDRRQLLDKFLHNETISNAFAKPTQHHNVDESATNERINEQGSIHNMQRGELVIGDDVDLLDVAGQSDGYMPGDLVLLMSRARSEAMIRSLGQAFEGNIFRPIQLVQDDFRNALKGFLPASLRNVPLQSSTTRWDAIGGLRETRQMLLETLQYPTTYAPIFAKCPLRLRSGLLLYGYPGCGKTLLASAVAGECGLNFISVRGPEILNKYIGASEKAVRDLFERAEAAKPCVLFFDEFDSIAPKRGHDSTGVTDRVVNQLLTQMDGAEGLSGVYVLAATSRPDLIDSALLRPGRLDKSLLCDMPRLDDRLDILKALKSNVRIDRYLLDEDHDDMASLSSANGLKEIARRCEGYSGADLYAVIYNAQLAAIHEALDDQEASMENNDELNNDSTKLDGEKSSPSAYSGFHDFTYFRYADKKKIEPSGLKDTSATNFTERINIAAQLELLQLRYRQQKISSGSEPEKSPYNAGVQANGIGNHVEPIIKWRHFEISLRETRQSISPSEQRRLQKVYYEFVVGRNGEMPSGQGGNEIGGRTSLM